MAGCPGPSTRLSIQGHSKTTSTYLNISNLVHGTRQVAHLVQKGPELGQGHLYISYPVGTVKFHMWDFKFPPSTSLLRPNTFPHNFPP